MRYKINEIPEGMIRVGAKVITNYEMPRDRLLEGEIGDITDTNFYIWNDTESGASGPKPIVGYKFSWIIRRNNDVSSYWIEFVDEVEDKPVKVINIFTRKK